MLDDMSMDYQPNDQYGSILQTDPRKPKRPSFLDAFQAGAQQTPQGHSTLMGGLAGQAGRGGVLGAAGRVASFLL